MNAKEKDTLKVSVEYLDGSPLGPVSSPHYEVGRGSLCIVSNNGVSSPSVSTIGANLHDIGDFLAREFDDARILYALLKFADPELYKDYDPYTVNPEPWPYEEWATGKRKERQ